mgnify:CR=1 FL=1
MSIFQKVFFRHLFLIFSKHVSNVLRNNKFIPFSMSTRNSSAPGLMLDNQESELRAFYDLSLCPVTFDIANFLVLAEIARLEMNCKHMRIIIIPAPGHGFRDLSVHSAPHSAHRIMSIVVPAIQSLPSCSGISLLSDRKSAENLIPKNSEPVFPYDYTLDKPTKFYTWKNTWEKINQNHDIQSLKAPIESCQQVNSWLSDRNLETKDLAVITLREANYQQSRNNNIREWGKFCSYLSRNGYQPLIIRDFDKTYDDLPSEIEAFPTCDIPNWNLSFRVALYERAKVAFFVNNGPWVFGLFNKNVDFLASKIITESVHVTSTKFRIEMGDVVGKNYSFLNERQKLLWKNDNCTSLIHCFEEYFL